MAKYEFKLPDIGEGVTEGEVVSWLVSEGDDVKEDQEMVEVMTDKATVTIGAPRAGKIVKLAANEGDVVPVGEVLVVFEVAGEAGGDTTAETGGAADGADEAAKLPKPKDDDGPAASAVGDIREDLPGMAKPEPRAAQPPPPRSSGSPTGSARESAPRRGGYFSDKPLAAPVTRRLARELGVDLRFVEPTGKGGRVTTEDVQRHAHGEGRTAAPGGASPPEIKLGVHDAVTIRPAPDSARKAPAPPPPPIRQNDERVPIRGVRRRIFENMARSKHTAAHFTYVDECNVTELRRVRERTKALAEAEGVKLSYLPFIVKAVVAALKRHPSLNCLVDDQAAEMILKSGYDIGIATATEQGLVVPVVRRADALSILDLAREIDRLADSAREGKIRREDLGGSSFTITSLGKLGGLFATPIVNYPEVAILGVHEMKKKPVVVGDELGVGWVMLLSLSFDHRVIDGHVGAAFAAEIIRYLETPERLLLEMS